MSDLVYVFVILKCLRTKKLLKSAFVCFSWSKELIKQIFLKLPHKILRVNFWFNNFPAPLPKQCTYGPYKKSNGKCACNFFGSVVPWSSVPGYCDRNLLGSRLPEIYDASDNEQIYSQIQVIIFPIYSGSCLMWSLWNREKQ